MPLSPTAPRAPALAAVALAALAAFALAGATPAGAALALGPHHSVHGGGVTFAHAGPYILGATAGQPDVGVLGGSGWRLFGGFWDRYNAVLDVDGGPGTGDPPATSMPLAFAFLPAQPNPARDAVRLAFDLPEDAAVRLRVLDVQGRIVRSLADGPFTAGRHTRTWDGNDAGGGRVAGGLYLALIETGGRRAVRKLVFIH